MAIVATVLALVEPDGRLWEFAFRQSYFGVNVTAFATVLGLSGLAISLAAKDTIADAIAGFIVLVDQPFRTSDRIEIQAVGTWGDVTDSGLRTPRIRIRDIAWSSCPTRPPAQPGGQLQPSGPPVTDSDARRQPLPHGHQRSRAECLLLRVSSS